MGGFDGPFRASTSGLKYRGLSQFTRLHEGVCIPPDVPVDAMTRARAAWIYADGSGVLGGKSAAAVHGTRFIDDDDPAELVRPRTGSRRTSGRLLIRNHDLPPGEVARVQGMLVTSPSRTAFDLGRTLPRDQAVIAMDSLSHATDTCIDDVLAVVMAHPRMRGVNRLRRVLPLVDAGSESPQETRTRLLLIGAGLPTPETQVRVTDSWGQFVARLDMGWPQWRVAVEYDGAWHWEMRGQRSYDIMRHEQLTGLGWRVVRVTARQLHREPRMVIARTVQHLRAAGAPA